MDSLMPTYFKPCGPEEYALLGELLDAYRDDLRKADARVTLLFAFSESDGKHALMKHKHRVLGRCQVNSTQDRAEGKGDATITLDGEWWALALPNRRRALLHHELSHIAPWCEKHDPLGRPKLSSRPGDWENDGFDEVVEIYGDDAPEKRWLNSVTTRLAERGLPFGEVGGAKEGAA
jgi:hypothetical protein